MLKNKFKNIELLTFDCYGTLIDWEKGMYDALSNFVRKRHLSISIDDLSERYIEIELNLEKERYRKYREILTLGAKRLLQDQKIDLHSGDEKIFARSIPFWPSFQETSITLNSLKKKGYKLAILSNIDEDLIKKSIKLMRVKFDGVVTAEQVKTYKPSFNHWHKMLKTFKIPKENVLHIAASIVHDIRPAKALGFKTVWINRKNEPLPKDVKTDAVFDDLRPLMGIL